MWASLKSERSKRAGSWKRNAATSCLLSWTNSKKVVLPPLPMHTSQHKYVQEAGAVYHKENIPHHFPFFLHKSILRHHTKLMPYATNSAYWSHDKLIPCLGLWNWFSSSWPVKKDSSLERAAIVAVKSIACDREGVLKRWFSKFRL